MRVGIDARELFGKPTGVGRYLTSLFREWSRLPEAARYHFVLYAPGALSDAARPIRDLVERQPDRFEFRTVRGPGGALWEQIALPGPVNHDGLDVFFGPAYSAPLAARPPLVVAIHDLSFVAHPEWFRPREGLRRRWLARQAARRARVVLTISEFSRDEIVERLGVTAARIRVTPPGVGIPVRAGGVARDPLVLYVGSIFNRRRVPDLIEAFALASRRVPTACLAIVGEDRSYPPQDLVALARVAGVSDRVTLAAYVGDDELAALYARAGAFAFLSEYEGFGLTPLEALAAGVPIVVLDTPVAREVYGDAAVFVPRGDIAAAADALTTLLTDDARRRELLARARPVLARYSWERTARETLAAFDEAVASAA